MTDVATLFPPQTYSSSFFLNGLGEEEGSEVTRKTRGREKRHEDSPNLLDCFITKMVHRFPVLLTLTLLIHSICVTHGQQSSECIDVTNPRFRTFKSLTDYQGNKISFNPQDEHFEGNHVNFSDGNMSVIEKNSFLTLSSDRIRKISLANHQINLIKDGAFLSLNCVAALELQKNNIEAITQDVFQGLPHLHELNLSENRLTEIPERIFIYTRLLQKLNLSRNNLKVLHSQSFYQLTLLKEFDISFNYLRKINPDMFQYFNSLINLQMGSNQFEYLEMEQWKNLTNLRVLNVSNNALKSVDFLYHFSFSSNLTELYLDDNYLTELNSLRLRKHLPSLQLLGLSENLWLCADLVGILSVLNDSRINYKGSETVDPNFAGISCNRSIEEYQKIKWTEPATTTAATPLIPTTPSAKPKTVEEQTINSVQIFDSIKSLQTTVICLFAVVVVFIFIDLTIRCRLSAFCRRHGRSPILDDSNIEDISLLRGRF